jgi:hypothetical protein
MTIGPEPISRMVWMSVRLGMAGQRDLSIISTKRLKR